MATHVSPRLPACPGLRASLWRRAQPRQCQEGRHAHPAHRARRGCLRLRACRHRGAPRAGGTRRCQRHPARHTRRCGRTAAAALPPHGRSPRQGRRADPSPCGTPRRLRPCRGARPAALRRQTATRGPARSTAAVRSVAGPAAVPAAGTAAAARDIAAACEAAKAWLHAAAIGIAKEPFPNHTPALLPRHPTPRGRPSCMPGGTPQRIGIEAVTGFGPVQL
eukprot:365028-Chlamydomonas_euryale.AAC.34